MKDQQAWMTLGSQLWMVSGGRTGLFHRDMGTAKICPSVPRNNLALLDSVLSLFLDLPRSKALQRPQVLELLEKSMSILKAYCATKK